MYFLFQIWKKHVESFKSTAASGNELPHAGVADGRWLLGAIKHFNQC